MLNYVWSEIKNNQVAPVMYRFNPPNANKIHDIFNTPALHSFVLAQDPVDQLPGEDREHLSPDSQGQATWQTGHEIP